MFLHARFDVYNVIDSIVIDGCVRRLEINPIVVTGVFKHTCMNKATGPDDISAFLLKTCAEELTMAMLFTLYTNECTRLILIIILSTFLMIPAFLVCCIKMLKLLCTGQRFKKVSQAV